MKFLRGLFHIVEKITSPIRGLLAKLKILHQIFLIIAVMSIFLVLEGILSLSMLNNMQTITQKVFSVSAQSGQFVSSINHEVESIRKGYIVSLLDNSPTFLNTSTFEFAYTGLQSLHLASISPNVAVIGERIELLKTLQNKPVNRENYEKLNQALTDITMEISTIERTIDSKVLDTMNSGNQYSEGSRNIAIIILIVSLIISLIIGLLVASLIVKPIKAMVHVAGLLSQGNLTENLATKGNREVNQLVDGLNNAITNLRKLVSNITEQAEVLDTASKELDSASNESGRAASEVARAMEEMAKATAEQTDQINQSSTNVSELGQLVRQVSNDTKNITQASEHVANSAKNGQKVTMDVAQNIDDLYETTKAVETVIHEMNESSEKIKEFASTISGIAEQTTLLALNAAIEAARAGEHGKGFSVVAKETGKLADQSKQASEMIGHLIANMINHSNQAVQVIQKGVAKVEAGKDLSSKATATFENIFKELEDTLNQIHSVAQSASQMEERNEQVINAVASVAAISEEAMASTQEISATIEGQSAGAEEVAALANNLTSIADSMKKSVATFKI